MNTNPDTESRAVVTLQSTNPGMFQRRLVPDLSVNGDFNFVRLQQAGIVLSKVDSAASEWTVGVKQ